MQHPKIISGQIYFQKFLSVEKVISGKTSSGLSKGSVCFGDNSLPSFPPSEELNRLQSKVAIEAANKLDLFAINLYPEVGTDLDCHHLIISNLKPS